MADETKITLKMGVIASFIGALVMFVMGCLYSHQTDITILKTNYLHVTAQLDKIEQTVTEIRNDQRRRELKESRQWK